MTAPRHEPKDAPNFDRLARPYRWMEYLSFGRALERCRFHWLDRLRDRRQALVLGDGDGRFTARLLAANPTIHVHAIDGSRAMLAAVTRRARRVAADTRLTTEQADLRLWTGPDAATWTGPALPRGAAVGKPLASSAVDLIVTHFFLDCLTTDEVARLARLLHIQTQPDTLWVVSEFAIPARGWMHPLAAALVAVLYRVFRLLTGLGPQRLPEYAQALERAGWRPCARREHWHGLLVSELWRKERRSGEAPQARTQ